MPVYRGDGERWEEEFMMSHSCDVRFKHDGQSSSLEVNPKGIEMVFVIVSVVYPS